MSSQLAVANCNLKLQTPRLTLASMHLRKQIATMATGPLARPGNLWSTLGFITFGEFIRHSLIELKQLPIQNANPFTKTGTNAAPRS